MEKSDIYQILGILVLLAIFIWENRKVSGSDKVLLWIIFGSIIAVYFILNAYISLKEKLNLVDKNKNEIKKLKDQLSIRKEIEGIKYKLGQVEGGDIKK
tara:strand:+ start:948 stop:1244 length:297 start_codon:yes stop_codon:yes gene_type:complete